MKNYFIFFFAAIFSLNLAAQVVEETLPPSYIRSVQLSGNTQSNMGNPILQLGEQLSLKFDDIIGDEADYYYTIEHYNYDWTPNQLAKSEYLIGFDDIRIFNYLNSYNTLQPFSHYELKIPNEDTGGFKLSGNYMIKIFNGQKELVFSRKFMVYENIARVRLNLRRSRDLNFIDEKQVVNFTIESPDLILKNPDNTVNVLITQNHNLKTAIKNIKPQYTVGNDLVYRYDSETAFWGGNEYIQFDNKELRASSADISSVSLNELYHHYLFPDRTRANEPYTYNPDINGQFVIRSLPAENPSIEAEYVWVHFKLQNYSELNGGEVHIYGGFNNFTLDKSTRLTYNEGNDLYEGARLFKQGFYNYKYVLKRPDGTIDEGFFTGNFDETENSYQVLVYYRSPGARYDRLIGVGSGNSTTITN
ncbi:type IX secretion system plug protein [Salegentibacter agarivorans]